MIRFNNHIVSRSLNQADRNFDNYYEPALYAVHGLSEFLLEQMHLIEYEGMKSSSGFFVGCTALERVEDYVEELKEYMQHLEKRIADLLAEKLELEGKIGHQCQAIPEVTTSGGNP